MEKQSGEVKIDKGAINNKQSASRDHANSPFRDLHENGHALNHSYKNPVPNESGRNASYMHPLENPARENAPGFPVHQGSPVSPLDQFGKGGK